LFYFTESSLTFEVDLVRDDKFPTIIFDVGHFLHIRLFLDIDIWGTDWLALSHYYFEINNTIQDTTLTAGENTEINDDE